MTRMRSGVRFPLRPPFLPGLLPSRRADGRLECSKFVPTSERVRAERQPVRRSARGLERSRLQVSGKETAVTDNTPTVPQEPSEIGTALMTLETLAEKIGQSPRLLRRLCDQRRITYRLIGKRRMLAMGDWWEYVASTVKPALPAEERAPDLSLRRAAVGRPLKGRASGSPEER